MSLESIWVGLRWIQYFSLFKYGFNVSSVLRYFILSNEQSIRVHVVSGTDDKRTSRLRI